MHGHPLTIGPLAIAVGRLKFGQMKQCRDDLAVLTTMKGGAFPEAVMLEAMQNVVFVAAAANTAGLTREAFDAALDELSYDEGIKLLGEAVAVIMARTGVNDPIPGAPPGEASSPATEGSTSSGSTG